MTIGERVAAYNRAYARWPASHLRIVQEQDHDVAYGLWQIGNDYRSRTGYYGSYPPGFLDRVAALTGDVCRSEPLFGPDVLHVFSGSLPASRLYDRCDAVQEAEHQCRVEDLPGRVARPYILVIADPPYTAADAARYGTGAVNRGKVLRALAAVTGSGGLLAWLDTTWPMHRKDQWMTVGRIAVVRSTNHRVRMLTLFQRVP